MARPFHVVLVEPEIPPNTGAIARTCGATQSPLHLVGPLGFRIDEHAVRRAGLDYWDLVDIHRHESFEGFEESNPGRRIHLFSASASRSYLEAAFEPGNTLSNEPGYYVDGQYGIRTETLILVTEERALSRKGTPFLQFETLTMCPIDTRLIDVKLLTRDERKWLNDYHRKVYRTLAPRLGSEDRDWLKRACAAV